MFSLGIADAEHAPQIAALRDAVAQDMTRRYGTGHWSSAVSEKSVLLGLKHAKVLMALRADRIVAVLRLATRKPWAIDVSYFTQVPRSLYLTDMAVDPTAQGQGLGRWLMDRAVEVARSWPADAIRLDAYDADAGAGGFYARCGFREVGRTVYRGNPLVYFEYLVRETSKPSAS